MTLRKQVHELGRSRIHVVSKVPHLVVRAHEAIQETVAHAGVVLESEGVADVTARFLQDGNAGVGFECVFTEVASKTASAFMKSVQTATEKTAWAWR